MEKIIVTAALPYSYSIPHLGNFVGSVLPADVYYRYQKMKGSDVIYICGSDQHGTAGELRALKEKTTPEQLSEELHRALEKLFKQYDCDFTNYGKTNTEANKETTYEFFNALNKNKYIVEVETKMPFCEIDNKFLADTFIEGTCPVCKYASARGNQCENCGRLLDPDQLIDPHCRICNKKKIVFKKVKNLALALDKLQSKIREFIQASVKNGWSKNATNKALSYTDEGLKPREITRSTRWGFPVPMKGYEDQTFYVWFDAILGYISITKEWSPKWKDYWMDKKTKLVQFMGKDNIEFHTLMWPGMLIGSNIGYTMPHSIRASEYLLTRGMKFSKSSAEGIDMATAIKILEADYWRFVLMQMYPETSDTDFTVDSMMGIVNGVMNDNIGNFINRVLKLSKENESLIDMKSDPIKEHVEKAEKIVEKYKRGFENFSMREALQAIVELSTFGNAIMGNSKPWATAKLAKTDKNAKKEFSEQMVTLLGIAYHIGILMWPFTPSSSMKVLSYFNVKGAPTLELIGKKPKADLGMEISPIFKKLDKTFEENFKTTKHP